MELPDGIVLLGAGVMAVRPAATLAAAAAASSSSLSRSLLAITCAVLAAVCIVSASFDFKKYVIKSMGKGKTIVEFFSAEIALRVWRRFKINIKNKKRNKLIKFLVKCLN